MRFIIEKIMKEAQRLNNLATQLFKEGKRHTAKALVKNSLALEPNSEYAISNYGVLLTNFGDYEEAEKVFHQVLEKNPQSLLANHGLGVLHLVAAEPKKAIIHFQKCMEIEPYNGSHRFDFACAVIQSGDWQNGFELYECRRDWKPEREFPQFERWNGEIGKKVYVWAEQGIGDMFQYARYLPWLNEISEKVTFAVPPFLLEMMQEQFHKMFNVVPLTGAMVDADYHVPMMSLAHYHGMHEIPGPLNFKPRWNNYKSNGKFKVGMTWACNPTSVNYRERSLPFEDLLLLTEVENTEFHSLQVGSRIGDITEAYAQNLVSDTSATINDDWCATRDLIASCDMVIATDTSVAHLAASMGIPTIMFLARRDWWRWGNGGPKTLWYPRMTIIRNAVPFKWEHEINMAYAILEKAAQDRQLKTLAA